MVGDVFRSLRVRNYRLFTGAQLVSLSGTWMQTVAQSWLVLRLTGSGMALGVVTGLQFLPTALGGMWGGLIADRFSKRRILLWTQSLSGMLALALGALTITGAVRLWMVYVLALVLGMVTAADTPARQAFVIEMVGPDDVANAIGLNSAVFNGARIVGPALAAAAIASLGLGWAFVINGATYLGPVLALVAMDGRALQRAARAPRGRGMLREGFLYAWANRAIRRTLLLMAVVATLGFNFAVTVPLLARFTFGGDVSAYAFLSSVAAGGGLVGALVVARRNRPSDRFLALSAAAFGLAAIATSFAPTLWWAAGLLTVTSGAAMAFIATANSTLQLVTPAHLRGRVMAIYALVFLGSTPFGGPVIGWISERWGARAGIGVGGVAALAAAAIAFATLRARSSVVRLEPAATAPAAEARDDAVSADATS
jgi:MFS family permease